MGFLDIFAHGLGASSSGGGDQESDSHVPPSRRKPPDRAEKERIRKHVEDQEKDMTPEEQERANRPPDGRVW